MGQHSSACGPRNKQFQGLYECLAVVLAFQKLKQEGLKVKDSLVYTVILSQKLQQDKNTPSNEKVLKTATCS